MIVDTTSEERMMVLVTPGGRRYCEVCHSYIGTGVDTPRCLHHAQQVVCSWCRKPTFSGVGALMPPECSTHCRNAVTKYDKFIKEQAAGVAKIQALEQRIKTLMSSLTEDKAAHAEKLQALDRQIDSLTVSLTDERVAHAAELRPSRGEYETE